MSKPKLVGEAVKLGDLKPRYQNREVNPNKLTDERFAALKALMEARGCLQPILVNKKTKEIIDGHHRYWCAQALGWDEILVIWISEEDEAVVTALGLAMNRLRGDTDLKLAAEEMKNIVIESGWEQDQLSLMTGFSKDEIELLMEKASENLETLGDVDMTAPDEGTDAPPDKPFVLEISFATKEQMKLARRKLRKAAGASKDLAIGLMHVLGEES